METIAIDSQNQNSLNKNVKKIRKKIQKGLEVKKVMKKSKTKKLRGVVYIGHIPHGFYENEIKAYASQFGIVTRVRVARSKRSGRSKGYAFVEFRNPEVATIFAETVDNYLMFNRLLKCHVIAPEKVHPETFATKITESRFNAQRNRQQDTDRKNGELDEAKELARIKKARRKISKMESFLKEQGLGCHFKINDPSSASLAKTEEPVAIVKIDESDDEITFRTPPNAIKVYIKSGTPKSAPQKTKEKITSVKARKSEFFLHKPSISQKKPIRKTMKK